jgi:hypothetical protein
MVSTASTHPRKEGGKQNDSHALLFAYQIGKDHLKTK